MWGGFGPIAHLASALLIRRTGTGTHFIYLYDPWSCMNRGVGGELSSEKSSIGIKFVSRGSLIGSSGCSSCIRPYLPLSSSLFLAILIAQGARPACLVSSQNHSGEAEVNTRLLVCSGSLGTYQYTRRLSILSIPWPRSGHQLEDRHIKKG